MNAAQKKLVLAAAIVVSVVLHFWFCRWEIDARYTSHMSLVGSPPDYLSHTSRQIVGTSAKRDYSERFTGISARNESSTMALIGGLVVPFVLVVAATIPLLKTAHPANPKRSP